MLHRNINTRRDPKMNEKIVASYEEFAAPVIEFNKIALGYSEKLVALNLAILRKQADVTLAAWREALAVKDPEGAKAYLARQGEVARSVVREYVADARAVAELSKMVTEDMSKVVESSITKVMKKAA